MYRILSGYYKVIKGGKDDVVIICDDANVRFYLMLIWYMSWFYSTSAGKLNKRIIPISSDN